MSRLIIAEKPSVAQAIAAALGVKGRKNGYIEDEGTIISWCFGHLAELASAETYTGNHGKWRHEELPILPQNWEYTVKKDKAEQFDLLRELMNRTDVTEVVNACDAGREGELIFRTVYYLAGCTKTMLRLWISSMEDEEIRKGFENLRSGSEYDGLYRSALCRARADWLVGINGTRLFSVLYHRKLNVGRVVSPTLALIVQRESEIEAFKPEPFYTLTLELDGITASGERFSEKSDAETAKKACENEKITVKSIERKEKAENPPLLYDLTTLQREANRKLGYTAQQTLDYLQSLYEKKLCTYPRTDSKFLTNDMAPTIPAIAEVAAKVCNAEPPVTLNTSAICDSTEVSDHHAIVPTISAGKADLSVLPSGEREILRLISRKLLCAVSEPFRYEETTVTFDCAGHEFTVKGKTILSYGWKTYMEREQEDKLLPDFTEGAALTNGRAYIKEGKTTPPSHFTEDSVLHAMETAGNGEIPDDAEHRGIGTPATRAAILEKLISNGFIERRKSKKSTHLVPTRDGNSLITVLPEQLQSPLLTADWEEKLKSVERGEVSAEDFLCEITAMLTDLTENSKAVKGAEVLFPSGREVIGKCPRCGGDVTESKKGFFCENPTCRFGMWRDNKFFAAKHVTLTKNQAAAMLSAGRVKMAGLYSEKTGKTYDATVVLDDNGEFVRYRLEVERTGA